MKKIILTAVSVLIVGLEAFAQGGFLGSATNLTLPASQVITVPKQELSYGIHGSYERPVTKTILEKSQTLNDFIDGYPENWIKEYVVVSMVTINNGKETKAAGNSNKLTAEQKNALKAADLNSVINIKIEFKAAKTLSGTGVDKEDENKNKTIDIWLSIIPETEAKYSGGSTAMNNYLKDSIISKIPESTALKIKSAKVIFTVNDKGKVDDVIVLKSSGDDKIDQLMKEAIAKMPIWKPAANANGLKVKQYFEFTTGIYGC